MHAQVAGSDRSGRARRVAAWGVLVLLSGGGADAAPAADPIEGRWLGEAGTPRERVVVGLEFRRDAQGQLALHLTQPIANYFDAKIDGPPKRSGDAVAHDAIALQLTLRGEELVGFYPGPNSPAKFRRVDALPTESAPPDVPGFPAPRWQARLGAQVYATPVVADGVVYIGSGSGVFSAIRVADGSPIWAFGAGGAILGDARVVGDAVYFVADCGFLFRLDRATGKPAWRYDLGDATVGRVLPHPQVFDWDWQAPQPLLVDDTIFVGAGDGGFHAVDAATGERRWRFDTRGAIRNGAAAVGDFVVFGSTDHVVYALRRDTGQEAWRHDTGAAIDATPVVDGDRVLVGNRGVGLVALDARTGQRDWRVYFWGSWVESTPTVADGVIYVGSSDLRRVSAIERSDGRVRWRSDVYGWTWGTPVVTRDHLFVGAAGGTPYFIRHVASLNQLDRRTGRILARWPLPDTGGHQWGIAGSPVLAGDVLLVATIEGSLYAVPLPSRDPQESTGNATDAR